MKSRPRRLYEGQVCLFDARSILDKRKYKGKILLKMQRQNASFESPSGVMFWKDHPFQLVPEDDVETLLKDNFVRANLEEVEDFYFVS